jgi:hypothetical protein
LILLREVTVNRDAERSFFVAIPMQRLNHFLTWGYCIGNDALVPPAWR